MTTIRFRIADYMMLIAGLGLVLALGSWVGWWRLANTAGAFLNAIYMAFGPALVPLVLRRWLRDAQGIILVLLVTWIVLACDILLIHVLLPVPICDGLQGIAMLSGFLAMVSVGVALCTELRPPRASWLETDQPSRRFRVGIARNIVLGVLALLGLAALVSIPRIKWEGPRSVGVAVDKDREGRLMVDFYGKGVNARTLRLPLDRKLDKGGINRFDFLGRHYLLGFLPYDESTRCDPGAVRRIKFHRTQVTDEVVPLLRQFPNLEVLDLRQTRISKAGVDELRLAFPACKVLP